MTEILITSSVLILVLAGMRHLLRGRVKPGLQYALWLAVLLRLMIPGSLFPSRVAVTEAAKPVMVRVETALQIPVSPAGGGELVDITPSPAQKNTSALSLGRIARLVWLSGAGLMTVWFILVNARLSRTLRRTRRLYARRSGISIYVAGGIPSPCLYGVFRPAVYLTEQAASEPELSQAAITHELTHYRHRDNLWAFCRVACLAVYWFNPLVWLAAELSRRDCELCCDASTVKRLGEGRRFAYGRALLDMTSAAMKPGDLLCGATTMTAAGRALRERVAMIAKRPRTSILCAAIALCVAAAAVGCTFSGAAETQEEAAVPSSLSDLEPLEIEQQLGLADAVIYTPKKEDVNRPDPELHEVELASVSVGEKGMNFCIYSASTPEEYGFDFQAVLADGTRIFSTLVTHEEYEEGGFIVTYYSIYWSEPIVLEELAALENFGSVITVGSMHREEVMPANTGYWDALLGETSGFFEPASVRVEAPEDYFPDCMSLSFEELIHSSDGWVMEYSEQPADAYDMQIILTDDAGRRLWLKDHTDEIYITGGPDGDIRLSCGMTGKEMVDSVLNWARLTAGIPLPYGAMDGAGDVPAEDTADAEASVPVSTVQIQYNGRDLSDFMEPTGTVIQLSAAVYPVTADNPTIHWFSTDDSIATVDETGLVTVTGQSGQVCDIIAEVGGVQGVCKAYVR